jgi:uncharacterized protein YyaL (SSP411 family)
MAKESFNDASTASQINERFVAIKVDREERPDLDSVYQRSLTLLGERGGWPLTLFLTPGGDPFAGGTYFPPEPRWGLPAFQDVLSRAADRFAQIREAGSDGKLPKVAESGFKPPPPASFPDTGRLEQWAQKALATMDPLHGGVLGRPKFPNCPVLELLWRAYLRSGDRNLRNAVVNTLDRISQGGIYDHLAGGFARYSVDARWLVPHFEKMLYDNAQLIDLLAWVWQETGSDLYRERITETVGWLLHEMTTPGGGFASTLNADTEHEEGRFYVWTKQEIEAVLGTDATLFSRHYDVTEGGNWEGRNVLNRLKSVRRLGEAVEAGQKDMRARLFAARSVRTRPSRDDKVLADWNGLAIASLARVSRVFGRDDWLAAAVRAWDFVVTEMNSNDNHLVHSLLRNRSHPAILDDYASMARAALALHEATGQEAYIHQAKEWLKVVDLEFLDKESSGYFMSSSDTFSPVARLKTASDGPTPPGNALLAEVFSRLHLIDGDPWSLRKAEGIVNAFSGAMNAEHLSHSSIINSVDLLLHPVQIALVGKKESAELMEMVREVLSSPLINRTLAVKCDERALPLSHPLSGKIAVGGHATAYVCQGATCSLPITSPAELRSKIRELLNTEHGEVALGV